MRFLRLRLSPALVPIGGGVERIEILSNQYLTDGTIIELSRVESDRDVGALFEANPATLRYEIVEGERDHEYVYHHLRPGEHDIHRLVSLLDEHRLLLVYPIRIDRERGAAVTLVGTTDKVQEAFDRVPRDVRSHVEIEQVSDRLPVSGGLRSLLTSRQREVLDAAIERGYYAIPRQATADEIAAAVGCAPSTASEHLRKLEARILSELTA